jgi:hypothetical protein
MSVIVSKPMDKRIAGLLSFLLLLLAATAGYSNDRLQDAGQRNTRGGMAAPPQTHDGSNLSASESAARKSFPKQPVVAILDGHRFSASSPSITPILQPGAASRLQSSLSRVNSVRAPPGSVLAL